MSSADMTLDDIGPYLRTARESQGQSIKDVAQKLCVRQGQISALEDSDFDDFPAPAYAKCMMRDYARLLGADADMLLSVFKQIEDQAIAAEGMPKAHVASAAATTPSRHPGMAVLAAGLFVIAAGVFGFDQMSTPKFVGTPEAPAHLAALTTPPADQTDLSGSDLAADQAQTVLTEPRLMVGTPEASYAGLMPASLIPSAQATSLQRPSTMVVGGADEIVLVAQRDTWVMLKDADAAVLWQGVLKAGQSFATADGTTLSVSDAGALSLKIGSLNLGPVGSSRTVVEGQRLMIAELAP